MTNLALGFRLFMCRARSVALLTTLPQIIHGSMLFCTILGAFRFRKSYIYESRDLSCQTHETDTGYDQTPLWLWHGGGGTGITIDGGLEKFKLGHCIEIVVHLRDCRHGTILSRGFELKKSRRSIDKKNNIYIEVQIWFFDKYDSEEDVIKNRCVERSSTFNKTLR